MSDFPANHKKKKMRKDANVFVDKALEKQADPKYKTEMCKTFETTSFCPYGNKCRFAHGKNDLLDKQIDTKVYKQRSCKSFDETGFCPYGRRCNFKHEQAELSLKPSYSLLLENFEAFSPISRRRLKVFESLEEKDEGSSCCDTPPLCLSPMGREAKLLCPIELSKQLNVFRHVEFYPKVISPMQPGGHVFWQY